METYHIKTIRIASYPYPLEAIPRMTLVTRYSTGITEVTSGAIDWKQMGLNCVISGNCAIL
jgi:hypothetical protein